MWSEWRRPVEAARCEQRRVTASRQTLLLLSDLSPSSLHLSLTAEPYCGVGSAPQQNFEHALRFLQDTASQHCTGKHVNHGVRSFLTLHQSCRS
ncbi:hypothetical protein Q8A67_015922 [Cirrhinus molitorella]|uniref:Uncharacterized protein n=1 Tax=Cirrhinus molitorella TaxID=172907 RepID=A0AA88PFN7_9TELE|nr:hypothetical protein Q8A67_015922 [Cirrhinus molitorella]